MEEKLSNQIVPYEQRAVIVYKDPWQIMPESKTFDNRTEIKQELPAICGRVLARAWIDEPFAQKLEDNINETFREIGVFLPSEYALSYDLKNGQRAKITIFEQAHGSKFKLKVCSLTLTMMAQR